MWDRAGRSNLDRGRTLAVMWVWDSSVDTSSFLSLSPVSFLRLMSRHDCSLLLTIHYEARASLFVKPYFFSWLNTYKAHCYGRKMPFLLLYLNLIYLLCLFVQPRQWFEQMKSRLGPELRNCVKGAIYCVNEDPTKRPGTMKEVLDVVNGKVEAPTWVWKSVIYSSVKHFETRDETTLSIYVMLAIDGFFLLL